MYKAESVLENETHKMPWEFEIQTDLPIPTRRQVVVLINKKKIRHLVDFAVPANHRVKNKEG